MIEDRLIAKLQGTGRRLTRQRQLVLRVLQESDEHLDAETLYQQVKRRDQRISLATVYRTLSVLKELGLVEEHRLGEEHGHFEAVQDVPHYHFTCVACGRVIEFEAPEVTEVVRTFRQQEQASVTDVHLLLSGFCSRCRSETERNNHDDN